VDWSGVSALAATLSVNAWAGQALSWFVMLLAMMMPLLWQPLGHVWDRSLAERRKRAVLLFLGGYFGLWMLAVAILTLVAVTLRIVAGSATVTLAIAAGVAMLWQMTPVKARFLNSCHAIRPLPAFGLAAEFGSFRYGMQIAFPCIAACWAIMLPPLAGDAGHTMIMALAAGWMLSERFSGTQPFGLSTWTRDFGSLVRNRRISRA
jgi:predicted metal-binding membrane protein